MNCFCKAALGAFLFFSSIEAQDNVILVEIKVSCPMSEEYLDFVNSIPKNDDVPPSFEEWKASFTHNMTKLIQLVESEKVGNSFWGVKIENTAEPESCSTK